MRHRLLLTAALCALLTANLLAGPIWGTRSELQISSRTYGDCVARVIDSLRAEGFTPEHNMAYAA